MTVWIGLSVVLLLVGVIAWRIAWVLRKARQRKRQKAPRNDIYPLW